jgi:hypothetical protein
MIRNHVSLMVVTIAAEDFLWFTPIPGIPSVTSRVPAGSIRKEYVCVAYGKGNRKKFKVKVDGYPRTITFLSPKRQPKIAPLKIQSKGGV